MVAGADAAFEAALSEHGFVREHRPGFLQVGFYHPEHPEFGVQQVTPPLFDGNADWTRNKRLVLASGGEVTLPSIEDMIADRLAQHAIASPTDTGRLAQARRLFQMAEQLDHAYLWRRITDEGGDPALIGLGRGAQEGE